MKTTPEDGTLDPETGAPTVPLARLRQAERERDEALASASQRLMITRLAKSDAETERDRARAAAAEFWQERDEAQRHAAALESELATRDGPLVDRLEALEAERDDLQRQRDALLRAVDAWHGAFESGIADTGHRNRYRVGLMLSDAREYCRDWTPAERARDAEERAGRAAAADEAALRYGG